MAFHFVAILSDYMADQRVAWHYASEDKLDREVMSTFMQRVGACGHTALGIHKLSTDSMEWASVVEKDSFFKDIVVSDNMGVIIERSSENKKTEVIKSEITVPVGFYCGIIKT